MRWAVRLIPARRLIPASIVATQSSGAITTPKRTAARAVVRRLLWSPRLAALCGGRRMGVVPPTPGCLRLPASDLLHDSQVMLYEHIIVLDLVAHTLLRIATLRTGLLAVCVRRRHGGDVPSGSKRASPHLRVLL